jgi:hypothetical protein
VAGGAEVLRAPVEGIVTAIGAGLGERLVAGAALATIALANVAARICPVIALSNVLAP